MTGRLHLLPSGLCGVVGSWRVFSFSLHRRQVATAATRWRSSVEVVSASSRPTSGSHRGHAVDFLGWGHFWIVQANVR
jgi:hypothetical protein